MWTTRSTNGAVASDYASVSNTEGTSNFVSAHNVNMPFEIYLNNLSGDNYDASNSNVCFGYLPRHLHRNVQRNPDNSYA